MATKNVQVLPLLLLCRKRINRNHSSIALIVKIFPGQCVLIVSLTFNVPLSAPHSVHRRPKVVRAKQATSRMKRKRKQRNIHLDELNFTYTVWNMFFIPKWWILIACLAGKWKEIAGRSSQRSARCTTCSLLDRWMQSFVLKTK